MSEARQTTAHHRELTDLARDRHDALTAAIHRLESALAAPAAQRAAPWSERVSTELELVRDAIRAHVDGVEEKDGLLHEIRETAPRLEPRVEAMRRDHVRMTERAHALAERVPGGPDADFGALRREAAGLLAELREHRASESDLVYEAFWTDLGAVD